MVRIEARHLIEEASAELGIHLADLIALSSVWISPDIYQLAAPVGGIWYPHRRRANVGLRQQGKQVEFVGKSDGLDKLDSNNYPNAAFKNALGIERNDFVGFHICHIWPGTVYDRDCFTNLANLVAIPAALASLSDHDSHIVACLKYRAWQLYGWTPPKESAPEKPDGYPERWRDPWPPNQAARDRAVRRVKQATRFVSRKAAIFTAGTTRIGQSDGAEIPERLRSGEEGTDAAVTAAFYLSKFDHEQLRLGNQGETIDRIARALGVNRHTLKSYRDYFDSHTGSRREGWKVALPPQLASRYEELMRLNESLLRARVLAMIH